MPKNYSIWFLKGKLKKYIEHILFNINTLLYQRKM